MSTKKQAYKITLKVGDRIFAGMTENTLSIKPNFEEIYLKENEGDAVEEFVDYDTEMGVSAMTYEKETGEAVTHYDFTELRAAAGTGSVLSFVHGEMSAGEAIASGNCKITEYSETAGSTKNAASWSLKIKAVKGSVVFGTY